MAGAETSSFSRSGVASIAFRVRRTTNFQATRSQPPSPISPNSSSGTPTISIFSPSPPRLRSATSNEACWSTSASPSSKLGTGFAYVGSQVPLEVGGEDFKLDLLFYHLKLRCFCVIDLKMTSFKPEYTGKMNFYLAAVDDMLRHPDDQPSIGLILCKTKNRIIAEYALRNTAMPIGISEFRHPEEIPEGSIKGGLPTIEEIEAELEQSEKEDRPSLE
jgi:hypothetical protein